VRRLLALLLTLTLVLLLVDLARPAWTDPLRQAAAGTIGPLQRWVGLPGDDLDRVRTERDTLRVERDLARAEREDLAARLALHEAATGRTHRVVSARVVGFAAGSAPVGSRTVTIDRGADDGVRVDQSVVATHGLVGRVLRTHPGTADVLVLGDPRVVVGVRFGATGALGSLDARAAPGVPLRPFGALTLTVLGDSPVAVGDQVSTLGSPGSVPFVPGVVVGQVTAVDPADGELGRTAEVAPAVDLDTLDHVGVVMVEDAP
jgi:rod shape-determining protein MreC